VGDLFIGLAALVTALSSGFALIWTTVRSGRKPEQVAKSAAEESAAAVVEALADGKVSAEEVEQLRQVLDKQREGSS
jgi:predicted transcriptional regulator